MDALLSPRRRRLLLGLGAATLAGCSRPAPQARDGYLAFAGLTMGSSYTVRAAARPQDAAELQRAVQRALDAVDAQMSLFRPDSELVRLNTAAAGVAVPLSPAVLAVLATAVEISALTDGAFDITVAPAVERWGFGTRATRQVPEARAVTADQARIDWRGLRIDAARGVAVKRDGALHADLGGIAKGYGVERAAAALDALGVAHYMVEVGGEVRTRGRNAAGVAWRIGVEEPDALPQRARWIVGLADRAMATSGDYRNYFIEDGRRYCHEIDPRRAAPIANTLASVTVVDADCTRADALATALMVLGAARGRALAESLQIAAHFVERRAGGGFSDAMTPAFRALAPERV